MPCFNLQYTPILILYFLYALSLLCLSSTVAYDNYLDHFCPNTTTFTANSSFQFHRDQLLSTLVSNATRDNGFYNATAGDQIANETVFGLFLCRGDLSKDACSDCVVAVASDVVKRCPIEKQAIIWYDHCMIRYSNYSFFSIDEDSPFHFKWNWNEENVRQEGDAFAPSFNNVVGLTMKLLVQQVANATKKFATKESYTKVLFGQLFYSLGQCTQDLSIADCNSCLTRATENLQTMNATGKKGALLLSPSCNIRFDLEPFYTALPSPPPMVVSPPPAPVALPTLGGKSKLSSKVIVSILASVALCVLVVVLAGFYFGKRLRRAKRQKNKAGNDITSTVESLQFDLGTILAATKKFSGDNKLGEGGFGEVFKGTLDNGQEIAVKRLSKSSGQGVREFKNEVVLVAKLQHRNLVRLLGFCLEGEETMLVYEYVPNKSLDHFLFESDKREQLEWSRRNAIIGGIAEGLIYLHEDSRLRVIHRDLKASNILLDVNMRPKISDFGMAKMFGVDDQTQGSTKRIVGTYGYMAPEYAIEGLYSAKSDVFSFGILLLEILTGRKNFLGFHRTNCPSTLLSYAWQLWNEGKVLELMDPLLKDSCSSNEFLRYIHIGLLCVQGDASRRPNMSSVVLMLKIETISLSKPERPAFLFTGRFPNDHIGANSCSANGLTISLDVPR